MNKKYNLFLSKNSFYRFFTHLLSILYILLLFNVIFTNFPNPFSNFTYIYVFLPKEDDCTIRIYNITGQVVKEYFLKGQQKYIVVWDGTTQNNKKVSKGGYICVLEYQNNRFIRKIGFKR